MRYKLDNAGYVCAVSFGCYLDNCTEYTGAVPTGYNNLDEWATYACIQAYYIDANGNLILDYERQLELKERQAQEAIDYAPLVRKDLYENDEVLDSQYIRQVETGKVIVLENIKTIAPRVRITNIEPYEYGSLTLQTQCKNMMPCTMRAQTVSGVSFTRNYNGSVGIFGKATANIEYVISDCNFTLKANENYYLNLGGLNCELRFNDNGEIAQQYIGASGLINLPKNTEVSQVVIKISNGQTVNTTFYPQLEYGKSFSSYVEYKCKTLNIDFSEYVREALFPSEDLFPSDDLYPILETTIDYILIENSSVTVSVDGIPTLLSGGAVGLFGSNSTIYANKDVTLEVEYSTNLIDVDSLEFLQGKSTTTNRFRILKDGSIEAHNGYFSGKIEADSGYFKGEINVNNRFVVDKEGNVTLPSNATLTWGQVTNQPTIPTNTNQLVNGAGYTTMSAVEAKGYQNAIQVTKITKDTVTAPFIEALNVKAGSVEAENIIGDTFTGKKYISNVAVGDYENETTIDGATITATTRNGALKSVLDYNGLDIIALSGSLETNITSTEITIKSSASFKSVLSNMELTIESSSSKATITYDSFSLKPKSSNTGTEITREKIVSRSASGTTTIDGYKIESYFGAYSSTTIEGKTIKSYAGVNDYLTVNGAEIYLYNGTTDNLTITPKAIKYSSSELISLASNSVTVKSTNTYLGSSTGSLGFFGTSTKSTKKSVTSITTPSTATVATVATKLNELLTALKAYNLIG